LGAKRDSVEAVFDLSVLMLPNILPAFGCEDVAPPLEPKSLAATVVAWEPPNIFPPNEGVDSAVLPPKMPFAVVNDGWGESFAWPNIDLLELSLCDCVAWLMLPNMLVFGGSDAVALAPKMLEVPPKGFGV
jgi:hypothetical protein